MPTLPKLNRLPGTIFTAALFFLFTAPLPATEDDDYQEKADQACRLKRAQWLKAGSPPASSPEGQAFMEALLFAARPDYGEELLVGGSVLKRMLPLPPGGERVELRALRTFKEFPARLNEEMFSSSIEMYSSPTGPEAWLARRLTEGFIEVWTAKHGWLFDRAGHLLHEAVPPRGTGWGRAWYGAFLPDGRWVTTDLDQFDGKLTFFSATGERLRQLTCEELAPRPESGGAKLLGWGRSDREGQGWVVNVGSEEGWATVWVGPDGPARVLKDGERWRLCYPRALGPRGTPWEMPVPDDSGQLRLVRTEAGHGISVGFPEYAIGSWPWEKPAEAASHVIPNGNYVFGFWPGEKSFFVGAETEDEHEVSGLRTRKFMADARPRPLPIVDKTWFFDASGKLTGWVRGRRVGDAVDGRAMLFRVTADSRIATVEPDLHVRSMQRFVWDANSIADAVFLWDDLRLGLFIRDGHLTLAQWAAPK